MDNFQIETAQNISIEHNLAGVGERILAFLVDLAIIIVYMIIAGVLLAGISEDGGSEMMFYLVLGLPAFLYYLLWETLGGGLFSADGINSSNFIISAALLLLAYILYFACMTGTVNHMILSYINNNGKIVDTEVSSGLKNDFGKILLLSFITGILLVAGFILLIIPGIYLFVPLSLVTAILVFRRNGVMDSISESFQLIKNNWWMTFASILCITIIVYLIGLVFQIPALIYIFVRAFTVASEGSAANPQDTFGTGYVIVNTISSAIQYFVYSILPIGFAFIYFNLNEKHNFTGTYETIDNLGNNS